MKPGNTLSTNLKDQTEQHAHNSMLLIIQQIKACLHSTHRSGGLKKTEGTLSMDTMVSTSLPQPIWAPTCAGGQGRAGGARVSE